jgi:HD-GYP domain-containing protein (c-di-GMP phosphodiesterase class II)
LAGSQFDKHIVDAFVSVVSNRSYQGREQFLGTEK